MASVFVGPANTRRVNLNALIDTGAHLSALEPGTWHDLDRLGLIERVPFADGRETQMAFLGGAASEYQLGRLIVTVSGPTATGRIESLPPVPVLAQLFLRSNRLLKWYPFILGFHLGVLDGRKLTREVVSVQPAPLAIDRGRQYGQEWYLESA